MHRVLLPLLMAAICRGTIIKEVTPFISEWALRSLRNGHAVYGGIGAPLISEWLRRSAGICTFHKSLQIEEIVSEIQVKLSQDFGL